jgi:hypothetical protein
MIDLDIQPLPVNHPDEKQADEKESAAGKLSAFCDGDPHWI